MGARIYVADLKAYNEGKLIGEWLDLDEYNDGDEVADAITDLTESWSEEHHEGEETEYAIHDFEGFDDALYSESMGKTEFDTIIFTNEVSEKHDIPPEVLQSMMSQYSVEAEDLDSWIDDNYRGHYNSRTDFAWDYIEQMGGVGELGKDTLETYFDNDSFARDLVMDYNEEDGHYFQSYKEGGALFDRGGNITNPIKVYELRVKERLLMLGFDNNFIEKITDEKEVQDDIIGSYNRGDFPIKVAKRIYNEHKDESYAKGGYLGKSADEVWNNWSVEQRQHFTKDHTRHSKPKVKAISLYRYDELPNEYEIVKTELKQHISEGQYARGGNIEITDEFVSEFMKKRFDRDYPPTHSYFKEWKERFENEDTSQMDDKSLEIANEMIYERFRFPNNYAKGGKTDDKTYHLDRYYVEVFEDSYEDGEGNEVHSWSSRDMQDGNTEFPNKDALFNYIKDIIERDVAGNYELKDDYFYVDDDINPPQTTITTSVIAKYNDIGRGYDHYEYPTEDELDKWKKGEQKLFAVRFAFFCEAYSKKKLSFGKGGKIEGKTEQEWEKEFESGKYDKEIEKRYYDGDDDYDNDEYIDTYTDIGEVLGFYEVDYLGDKVWKSDSHRRLAQDLSSYYYIDKSYAKGGKILHKSDLGTIMVVQSDKYDSEYWIDNDGDFFYRPIQTDGSVEEWSQVDERAFNEKERKEFDKEMKKLFGTRYDLVIKS